MKFSRWKIHTKISLCRTAMMLVILSLNVPLHIRLFINSIPFSSSRSYSTRIDWQYRSKISCCQSFGIGQTDLDYIRTSSGSPSLVTLLNNIGAIQISADLFDYYISMNEYYQKSIRNEWLSRIVFNRWLKTDRTISWTYSFISQTFGRHSLLS